MSSLTVDYRHILKAEFERRFHRNARYSLRAYARDLNLSPSKLSEVLSRKRGLSPEAASRVAERLQLTPWEVEQFVLMVQAEHARSALARDEAKARLRDLSSSFSFSQINLDVFETIANWTHFAILELLEIKDFQPSFKWIADRIGLEKTRVQESVKRLQRLRLIEKDSSGRWLKTHKNIATPDTMASRAVRSHHFQILKKADNALENVPMEFREFSTTMMAIDVNDLPEAKEALKEFRRRFCKSYQETENKNSLYCLSMQFFPLDWQKDFKNKENYL